MERTAFYRSRDSFFIFLVWIALILVVLKDPMLHNENPRLLAVIFAGGLVCSLPTLMHYKNFKSAYIKYISATLLPLITLYALCQEFNLFNLVLLYVNLVFLSVYANYRLILYNGLLVCVVTLGTFLMDRPERVFLHQDMLPLLAGVLLTTATLAFNAHRMEKVSAALKGNRQAYEQVQCRTQTAAEELQGTVDLLYQWCLELEQELQHAYRMCNDITSTLDSTNTALDLTAETAAAQETELPGRGQLFEADLNFLCNPDSSLKPQTSYSRYSSRLTGVPDMRERFLRITAKMLHLSENMETNKQAIEDIKAGLSHQYNKISDLIQVTKSPSTRTSKSGPLNADRKL